MEVDKSYLLKHVNTFFGSRNGRFINLTEGVNYTLETLTYMTPKSRADEITRYILSRCLEKSSGIIIDATAGIGGNLFSFIDSGKFKLSIAYEINPSRREMLRLNLLSYGFDRSRYQIEDTGFQGVSKELAGSILYFDPPWLPPGISGDKADPSQYLLSNIKVGDYSLEEWLDFSRHCSLICIRVPPNYKLGPVPNYNIEYINIKKSCLILARPE
jgi:hypothetical protein